MNLKMQLTTNHFSGMGGVFGFPQAGGARLGVGLAGVGECVAGLVGNQAIRHVCQQFG